MIQLSHPYMIIGKTVVLTIWTFVGKVMSLLFNTLSRFVITFLSRRRGSFSFMAAVTVHSNFVKHLTAHHWLRPLLVNP